MGYLYLLCVALMFSFGGTCVKLISPYFSPAYITFFRFFVGVGWLLLLKLLLRQGFAKKSFSAIKSVWGWILLGAVAKWFAYLTENYALSHGPSYGNIVTQPAQTVFIVLVSILLFQEKLSPKKIGDILLCLLGVACISLNGRFISVFFQENLLFTCLFVFSGVCAGCHVLAQKKIADKMNIVDSNLFIFSISALLSAIPLFPGMAGGALSTVTPSLSCILAILAFGFITGFGFYLNAKAIPLVPFHMVPILQSSMAIFAIIWAVLFFHETITIYIIGGTLLFIIGVIRLQR